MARCTNYQCPQYDQHHEGVGQSPGHPADAGPFVFWMIVMSVVAVGLVVFLS